MDPEHLQRCVKHTDIFTQAERKCSGGSEFGFFCTQKRCHPLGDFVEETNFSSHTSLNLAVSTARRMPTGILFFVSASASCPSELTVGVFTPNVSIVNG